MKLKKGTLASAFKRVTKIFPPNLIYPIIEGLSFLMLPFFLPRSLSNLNFAFKDEMGFFKRVSIARRSLANFFKMVWETAYVCNLSSEEIKKFVDILGKENLDRALAKKKGVLALSAHFGTFTLIGARLVAEGYTYNLIRRPFKDEDVESVTSSWMENLGYRLIPQRPYIRCVKLTLSALKEGGIVGIVADENKRRGGVFVDFFGELASTAKGPAKFALATDAPVVPMFMQRKDGKLTLRIMPEVSLKKTGDTKRDVLENTALFTKIIEKEIRRYPCHWFWTKKRWKTKPVQKLQKTKREKDVFR